MNLPSNPTALHTSALSSLPLLARGKVRDNYAVGTDRILMVASDRISAFDVIMGEPIPGKGELLTQMALFWFDKLGHLCPNHLTGEAPESVVSPAEAAQVRGRSMLVQRLQPIPVEAVVRGYLAGSGWKEYQESQSVCGVPLPAGLTNAAKLPSPIYTPAAKAAVGEHDENITFERTVEMIGPELAAKIRDVSIAIYQAAADIALAKGMIIADTKFEFGLDPHRPSGADGRGADPRQLALLACGRLRSGPGPGRKPTQLRQAVPARLAGAGQGQRQALGQDRPCAAPAAGGHRKDRSQVPRGTAAPDGLSSPAPPGRAM
jgi:phosphoribosylaminoimidazole-succinocarboxamide synthase